MVPDLPCSQNHCLLKLIKFVICLLILLLSLLLLVVQVCRDMTTMTKVRVINSCIGADLICLSEQPLHAVPLFVMTPSDDVTPVQYDIPQWINHSFYTRPQSNRSTSFVPCLRIPSVLSQIGLQLSSCDQVVRSTEPQLSVHSSRSTESAVLPRFDFDDYDARVFDYHPNATGRSYNRRRFLSSNESVLDAAPHSTSDLIEALTSPPHNELHQSTESFALPSQSPIKVHSFDQGGFSPRDRTKTVGMVLSRPGSLPRNILSRSQSEKVTISNSGPKSSLGIQHLKMQQKPFINPFSPNDCTLERTANAYRWRHTFPSDQEGKPFQDHHGASEARHATMKNSDSREDLASQQMTEKVSQACQVAVEARLRDRGGVQDDEINGFDLHYSDGSHRANGDASCSDLKSKRTR